MLRADVKAVNVIEVSVPGFGHHRQGPPITARVWAAGADAPGYGGVANHANTMSVGQQHRPLKLTGFLKPRRPGHFSVAIEGEPRGEHRNVQGVASARQNGGDPGPDFSGGVSFDIANKGHMTDGHPCHVGDGVKRAGRTIEGHAEVAGARLGVGA
jgi:hypothetical protein